MATSFVNNLRSGKDEIVFCTLPKITALSILLLVSNSIDVTFLSSSSLVALFSSSLLPTVLPLIDDDDDFNLSRSQSMYHVVYVYYLVLYHHQYLINNYIVTTLVSSSSFFLLIVSLPVYVVVSLFAFTLPLLSFTRSIDDDNEILYVAIVTSKTSAAVTPISHVIHLLLLLLHLLLLYIIILDGTTSSPSSMNIFNRNTLTGNPLRCARYSTCIRLMCTGCKSLAYELSLAIVYIVVPTPRNLVVTFRRYQEGIYALPHARYVRQPPYYPPLVRSDGNLPSSG